MPPKSRNQPAPSVPEADTLIQDAIRKVEAAVQEGLTQLRSQSKVYADAAGQQIEAAAEKVSDEVRARPLAATGIALGVGVLIGFLISSASRK